MKAPTVKTNKLAEIIAKCLFGIETVPPKYMKRMITRAVKEACKYHEDEIAKLHFGYTMMRVSEPVMNEIKKHNEID